MESVDKMRTAKKLSILSWPLLNDRDSSYNLSKTKVASGIRRYRARFCSAVNFARSKLTNYLVVASGVLYIPAMLECGTLAINQREKLLSRELRVIGNNPRPRLPKPEWLKIRLGDPANQNHVLKLIEGLNLHTVCQEARCPNIFECWSDRTATFMLGGDICTRHCGFCAVGKGEPGSLDREEPRHVAEAVRQLNLAHTVITSVNRDDLPDGGAAHWAETVRQVRALNPECRVEVLIPDFNGDEDALNTVLDSQPDVLNHNTETVARLYRRVRPDAGYEQSLTLLRRAGERRDREARGMKTKSGIMVGLGETFDEVVELMKDLRAVSCDIMTIGQYLQPHARRLPVERYVTPEEFERWRELGMDMGFKHVESSPLTRSSYHARQQAEDEPRVYADTRG